MQPERWRQVESLFQSALERPPEARVRFIEEACQSDTALRDEIEVLLAAYERCDDFLEAPAFHDGLGLLESPAALKPGDRMERYEILSRLGAGGMGEVYLARDPGLARKVAIKVLPRAFAADKERVDRLSHEGRTASALNHPNILTVHEIGEAEGRKFLVTEFVDGVTLRTRLQEGRVPPEEAFRIAKQVASALEASHSAGVLHRDIKPENIMLRPDGYVKVLDFGLAKMLRRADRTDRTKSTISIETAPGKVAGSIHYMSPEQLSCRVLDARTDLWSLGVVLYEMLEGTWPFLGTTPHHIAVAILESDPAPLRADVPARLKAVIHKALTKEREKRYASARELLIDLDSSRTSTSSGASSRSRRPPETTYTRAAWVLAAALAIVGVYQVRPWPVARGIPVYERMLPLTNSGNVKTAAISRDGKYLAFATDSGQQQSLWLRQISTKTNLLRSSPEAVNYRGMMFSPDGSHIYYVVQRPSGEGLLLRAPAIGGDARTVISDVDGPIALSPDGRQIAFLRGNPDQGTSSLMLASADGAGERTLAIQKASEGFLEGSLAWLPGEDAVAAAVWRPSPKGRQAALVATRIASGKQWTLGSRLWTWVEALQWSGNELFIVGTKDPAVPASQIFRFNPRNGAVANVTNDAGWYSSLSVTASGSIVAVQKQRTSAIWVSDSGPSQLRKATSGGSQYFGVSWAANGRLLTEANVGGTPEVWSMDVRAGSLELLTQGQADQRNPRACADGRYILFTSAAQGSNRKIWRIDADGRNPLQLTGDDDSTEGAAVCTPDGKWVVFNSNRSGKTTLWRVSIDGSVPEQLTPEVSYYPEVSPDGKMLACTLRDSAAATDGAIALIPIAGGSPIRRFKDIPMSSPLRWGPGRDTLTFIRTADGVSNLFFRGILDAVERQLTSFNTEQIFAFDWSRDFSRLALLRGVEARDAMMLTLSAESSGREK